MKTDVYFPPDFTLSCGRMCPGNPKELLPEVVRMYPNPVTKRTVTVTFNSWEGLAPGAKHTWVSIKEEDNPVWDGRPRDEDDDPTKPNGWTKFYQDDETFPDSYRKVVTGRLLSERFLHRSSATRFAKRTLLKEFPPDRYQYRWGYKSAKFDEGKWAYGEGD